MADLGRLRPELEPPAHGPGPAHVFDDPGNAHNNEASSQASSESLWHDPAECFPPGSSEKHKHPSREVSTGLPRVQTFKRRLSEQREHLEPVAPSAEERRTISMERRCYSQPHQPKTAQLDLDTMLSLAAISANDDANDSSRPASSYSDVCSSSNDILRDMPAGPKSPTEASIGGYAASVTTSQHEAHEDLIANELKTRWILNLSMHFRDRSKREKFFVTYQDKYKIWRRVTISLDYRNAPEGSLELDLDTTEYQRDKSAKIYETIRDSLPDIQFYDTVTNLKLQTTDGRLHVHVVEDGNETITYPTVDQIRHLRCRRVREEDITFDSHMSGFVYKVSVDGETMIKKEIPGRQTIEEFLYEINALDSLRFSKEVVQLHGVVVDDCGEQVKGLLIGYAEQGALADIIYDSCKVSKLGLPWHTRQRWARQIVQGLADVHDSGFVQGDFTLSNIVVDKNNDAKIIDINRRGCPCDWEPPELTSLVNTGQNISMYIGEKSDLFQLGMVLWALAVQEDEPERLGRPLMLGPEVNVPDWFRHITEICLSGDPRMRMHASTLLHMFPKDMEDSRPPAVYIDDTVSVSERSYYRPSPAMLGHSSDQSRGRDYLNGTHAYNSPDMYEPYFPPRGRSPPSPLPNNLEACESPELPPSSTSWAANKSVRPSYSDYTEDESESVDDRERSRTPVSEHRLEPAAPWLAPYERRVPMFEHRIVPPLSRHPTAIRHSNVPDSHATEENGVASTNADHPNTTDSGTPTAAQSEADGGVSLQLKKINGTGSLNVSKENTESSELLPSPQNGVAAAAAAAEPKLGKGDDLAGLAPLPMSLVGVGAGIGNDDEAIRKRGNMADEFNALSAAASAEGQIAFAEMTY